MMYSDDTSDEAGVEPMDSPPGPVSSDRKKTGSEPVSRGTNAFSHEVKAGNVEPHLDNV